VDIRTKRSGILNGRQGVKIGDEIIRLAPFLKLDGRLHHTKVVAKVRRAGGLDAGKNSHPRAVSFSPEQERTFFLKA
jgi:hypothetical protein